MKTWLFATLIIIGGCAPIDYQALSQCGQPTKPFSEPLDQAEAATLESIRFRSLGTDDTWVAIVTHVNCERVDDPWEIVHLPPGNNRIIAAFGKYHQRGNSAQWLEFNVEPGTAYELHVKPLVRWDMAFWITDGQTVVAHTPNYKESFAK